VRNQIFVVGRGACRSIGNVCGIYGLHTNGCNSPNLYLDWKKYESHIFKGQSEGVMSKLYDGMINPSCHHSAICGDDELIVR
jgi:hypothetical protein